MQVEVEKQRTNLEIATQTAVYTRIGAIWNLQLLLVIASSAGASAVNHEAKRAISNAMTCEIENGSRMPLDLIASGVTGGWMRSRGW